MPQGSVPTKPPTFRTIDYGALVRKAWGDAWHQKETAYQFSNGRKFDDPGANGGAYYTGTGT
jgi:hypothetical protein